MQVTKPFDNGSAIVILLGAATLIICSPAPIRSGWQLTHNCGIGKCKAKSVVLGSGFMWQLLQLSCADTGVSDVYSKIKRSLRIVGPVDC